MTHAEQIAFCRELILKAKATAQEKPDISPEAWAEAMFYSGLSAKGAYVMHAKTKGDEYHGFIDRTRQAQEKAESLLKLYE